MSNVSPINIPGVKSGHPSNMWVVVDKDNNYKFNDWLILEHHYHILLWSLIFAVTIGFALNYHFNISKINNLYSKRTKENNKNAYKDEIEAIRVKKRYINNGLMIGFHCSFSWFDVRFTR